MDIYAAQGHRSAVAIHKNGFTRVMRVRRDNIARAAQSRGCRQGTFNYEDINTWNASYLKF